MNPKNLYMLENFSYSDPTVVHFSSQIEKNGDFEGIDPPKVYTTGGKTYVVDGNHRVKAARGCSLSWIPVNHINDAELRGYGYNPDTIHLETSY
jgi:hypothetical protein